MGLKGKHILVTGASQGIGRAIARELMAQGGRVVVHFNTNERAARDLIAEFPNTHSEMVQADLENPEDVSHLFNESLNLLGHLGCHNF